MFLPWQHGDLQKMHGPLALSGVAVSRCESFNPQGFQCEFQVDHTGPHMSFATWGEGEDIVYPHWAWRDS